MKTKIIFATIILLATSTVALAINIGTPKGFSQANYFDSPTFEVPNAYASQVMITFQIPDVQPGKKLSSKDQTSAAAEDPNQIVQLYVDPQLQLPLYSNPIDLDSYRDGAVHTIPVYVKYYSTTGNAISKAGNYNFSMPLYINGDNSEYTANLNMNPNVTGTCHFLQSSYNVLKTSPANTIVKDSTTIGYNCGTNISPMISVDSVSYASDEDATVTMKVFGDSSYTNNLASNPIALVADGSNKNYTLYMQYFANGNEVLSKAGTYNFHTVVRIDY